MQHPLTELPRTEEQAVAYCRRVIAGLLAIPSGAGAAAVPRRGERESLPPRSHFHLEPEMFIQVSGKTIFRCPKDNFALTPGGVCVIPRRVSHAERALSHADTPFVNIVVMCRSDRLALHVADAAAGGRPKGVAGFTLDPPSLSQKLAAYLDDLCEAAHGAGESPALLAESLTRSSLALLLALLDAHEPARRPDNYKVRQCKTMIAGSLADPDLSVEKLAEWIRCAPDYLSHLFHKETGQRLTAYLNQLRLAHATDLLKTTSLNIAEVASACGFEDQGYFTRLFRQTLGETPSTFRRLHQPPPTPERRIPIDISP